MKRLFLLLVIFAGVVKAQAPWVNVLDPSRAIDWRQNPARTFVIPSGSWTQCVNVTCLAVTSAGTSVTVAQINSAIQNAPPNTYVLIGPGTYPSLNGCINWSGRSHVVLRGSGTMNTIFKFIGGTCSGLSGNTQIFLGPANANGTFNNSPTTKPGQPQALTLTGTVEGGPGVYPSGAQQLTVSGVGSDTPKVGTMLMIDQADDSSIVGNNTGWLQCQQTTAGNACSENGNGSGGRVIGGQVYEQTQVVTITSCNGSSVVGTSCGSATTYTIFPGLYGSAWRASQTPGAWWNAGSTLCTQCGIENITLDFFSGVSSPSAFNFYDCYQCWLTGSRILSGGSRNDIYLVQSEVLIFTGNYFFATKGNSSGGGYVFDVAQASDALVENNFFDQVDNPLIFEEGSGWIVGYNFSHNNIFINPQQVIDVLPSHDAGSMYNLYEGNNWTQVSQDTQHGPSPVITYFRNRIEGNQPVPFNKANFTTPIELQANQRGTNFLGNVLGIEKCSGGTFNNLPADMNSQCTGGTLTGGSYQLDYQAFPGAIGGNPGAGGTTTGCPNVIYMIGWPTGGCAGSSGNLLSDPGVHDSMVRWGNYDTVNAAVQWNPAEATTIAGNFLPQNFSNAYFSALPHTLPSSFYYDSQPSWWQGKFGTPPFPPHGPEVTGGDMGGVGGHSNRNLARLCFDNTPQDNVNYPSTAILAFDPNNCYGAASGLPSLSIVPSPGAFGNQNIYSTSSTLTLTVSNVGSGVENLSSPYYSLAGTNPNDFQVVAGTCVNSGTISIGGSCTIVLTFIPNVLSAESSTLTVLGTVNGSVNLTGTGVQPQGNHACIITGPVAELGICN